ncbi:MAG: hypothetical protein H7296_06865 [Bacteroidia bacterium]|nr:hypothetical protein [Bacteroidia bacterium]
MNSGNIHIIFVLLFFIVSAVCCKHNKEQNPLAKAYGKQLVWAETAPLLLNTKNQQDSISRLKKIVEQWINQQIKLNAANRSINSNDPEIEEKVNNYRNDLLIYFFEQNKVNELLDTNISVTEMKALFERNKENFHLSNNVVKLVFVKIKSNEKIVSKMKTLLVDFNGENKTKLLKMCNQYAENAFLEDQIWLNFDDIIKEVPIKTYDAEHFLENNKYVEIKEGPYIYLVNILAYQIKNTTSSFEFERENIKKVILQNRKKELLKQMEITLKKEAEMNKDVESFMK